MQKIGINIDAFENSLNPDCTYTINLIAELGFGAVFSDATFGKKPTQIASLCNAHNLEYQFVHAPFKGTNNIWLDTLDGDEMLKKITDCLDDCGDAGVPIAVVHVSSGYTPPPISEIGKDRFKRMVEHAQKNKVKIAFENLREPNYLKWAMDTFDNSVAGFCWDIGHENCFTEGIEYMSVYGERLLCTHIHDNNKVRAQDLHLIPFDGKIDFEKMALQLKNSNYDGPLMLEVFSKNKIYDGMCEQEFFAKAYKAIEKIQSFILR